MPPSPLPRLRPLGRAVLQRLRLLGWSYVVAGLSAAGIVVALVLGALALPLLLPVGSTLRPAIAQRLGQFADVHRWIVGSTLHDERPHGYGSVPFDPRGLARASAAAGAPDLRRDLTWLVVSVPVGFLVAALVGVLPIVSLNAASMPLQYGLLGQQSSTVVLAPASSQAASLVMMAVGAAGLLLWWWGAARVMRGYALLSRRLLGAAATTALTARVGRLLAARAAAPPGRTEKLGRLTPREREVLALVAEGRTNAAVAARLFITDKAVDKHLTSVFRKLDLPVSTEDNRRVLAARAFLQSR